MTPAASETLARNRAVESCHIANAAASRTSTKWPSQCPVPWKAIDGPAPHQTGFKLPILACRIQRNTAADDASELTHCTLGPLPEVLQIPCLHQHKFRHLSYIRKLMRALDPDNLLKTNKTHKT